MMRRTLTLLLALLAAASPALAEPISRRDTVARALKLNPTVRRSIEDMTIFDGRKKEALADALPELTLYGVASRYRDPSILNSPSFDNFPPELIGAFSIVPAPLYDAYASVRQTLFSFKVGAAIKGARFAEQASHENARRVEQDVALGAIRAYNAYLLSLERARVAEKALRQREQQLEMARNRRGAGVATDLEVLRFQVAVENQRAQFERERGRSDIALGQLNAVMLRPIDAPLLPTDTLDYEPMLVTLDEVVAEALASRPDMRQLALTEKAYDQLVRVTQADSRPSLDLLANYGWSVRETKNFFDQDFTRWNVGVTLTVPVFDGNRTAGRVMQAKAERRKVDHSRTELELQIRLEAKDSLDRLSVSRRVLDAAELNVTQAQKALDMTQANYRFGAATTLDVLDAQAALTIAESLRAEALYENANARSALRYVMGRDPLGPVAPAAADPVPAPSSPATTGEPR